MLCGVPGASPWATGATESARYLVEVALCRYSSGLIAEWGPSDEFDEAEAASLVPDHHDVWTDGSLVLDQVTGVSSSGAGFFAHQSENSWSGRRWGHVDGVRAVGEVSSCGGFCSVPGPPLFVQRAEMWGVILALQSSSAIHFGVDNLGVVRHVGRLLDGRHGPTPFELVKDGDLFLLIERMLHLRGLDTVQITKVKGHVDEGMVLDGRVGKVDKLGNDAADEAADFGRRRVGNAFKGARRNLSAVCRRWYPVILDLHRLFIPISRALVNHDGRDGTAPDPLVWSAGALPKRRRLVHAVRDWAFLPGRLVFGIRNGLMFLLLLSVLKTLLIGPTLLVSWLSGSPFQAVSTGLLVVWILELLVFYMWNCSCFMSFGLVRGSPWRRLTLVIFDQGVQFQFWLFLLVLALIFGPPVVLLVL